MRSLESWVFGYIVNSLWQIPLLFGTAWLAARWARTCGSRTEHRVWVAALLLQAILPGCSAPSWHWLRSLWTGAGLRVFQGDGSVSVVIGPGVGIGVLRCSEGLWLAVSAIYGALLLYFLARLLGGLSRTLAIRRNAQPVQGAEWGAKCRIVCAAPHNLQSAEICTSSDVRGPVTIGLRRHSILVPPQMLANLREEDLRVVLAHEYAHIRRHDFAKNLLYQCVSLPIAYHPLAWATRGRLAGTREEVCDRVATESGIGTGSYGRSLLRMAALIAQGPFREAPQAIGIFDAHTFERRLMKLTEKNREVKGMGRIGILAACVALGTATCASAVSLRTGLNGPAPGSPAQAVASQERAAQDGPAKVPGSVMAGNALERVVPVYPQAAKVAGITGAVILHAIIGRDGAIESLDIVSGPKELRESAWTAVRQWKYKPYLLHGVATAVDTTITVTYSLAG